MILQAIYCAPRDVPTSARYTDGGSDIRARDEEWALKVQEGDERSFEALFRAYVAPLVNFAASYIKDADAAREIVSDVFFSVWDKRLEWRPQYGVAAYLFGAVRNRALNHERNRRRLERRLDAFAADPDLTAADYHPDFSVSNASDAEIAAVIDRMFDQLPEARRRIMVLHWQHHLTADQIAESLGMNRNAVYVSLHRSLKMLRELFGEHAEQLSE